MKRNNLKKIALMSLASGMFISTTGCEPATGKPSHMESQKTLSASELYSQLSPEAKRQYDQLDNNGKELALKLANQSCAGKNGCRGLNSCQTNEHSCKGQGSCKGTGKGPFINKDDTVKVAAMHMDQKRQNLMR